MLDTAVAKKAIENEKNFIENEKNFIENQTDLIEIGTKSIEGIQLKLKGNFFASIVNYNPAPFIASFFSLLFLIFLLSYFSYFSYFVSVSCWKARTVFCMC